MINLKEKLSTESLHKLMTLFISIEDGKKAYEVFEQINKEGYTLNQETCDYLVMFFMYKNDQEKVNDILDKMPKTDN